MRPRAPKSLRLCLPLALALVACGEDETHGLEPVELTPTAPRAETPPAPPSRAPLVQRSRPIMGTVFQVSVAGMSEEEAAPLIRRALDEIDRLEEVLSEWRETSEISRVNAAAGGEAVEVGPDALAVVDAGLDVSRWSRGAFDLSWAALRGLYTFQPGEEEVPAVSEVRARLMHVDWEAIEVDEDASSVRLARAGMSIGTGGIGKGYALDRAGQILRDGGAENYMLFGGGQVQVHGMRGDRPWRVGIQHPRQPSTYIGFLEVTDGSISTSGDYEHAFVAEGRHWHHIIDLSTGLPAAASMQVTLLSDRGMYADALSTAAFILGPEAALRMLDEIPGHHEAIIIGPDLTLHTTPGTRERMVMRVTLESGDRLPGDPEFQAWERPAPLVGPGTQR